MDLTPLEFALLFAVAVVAGVMNVVGGAGSVLMLPAMIACGIPAVEANATNRLGLLPPALVSIHQFRRKGIREDSLSWRLVGIGIPGALVGTWIAAHLPDEVFRKTLGILMLALLGLLLVKPRAVPREEADADPWAALTTPQKVRLLAAFAGLGIYVGFLQAGAGVLVLVVLSYLLRMELVRANYIKILFIFGLNGIAFLVFVGLELRIHWGAALALLLGQSVGAWAGSWVALNKGERWMISILVFCTLLSSAYLLDLLPFARN